MLVLSRRNDEKICFPELGISINILQVKGPQVRVGVQAPIEISVVRGELVHEQEQPIRKILISAEDEHAMRNQLNTLALASATAKRYLQKGETQLAANLLDNALQQFSEDAQQSKIEPVTTHSLGNALLIEDISNERELLAGFLRLHGYHVDTAGDGVEAIEFLEDNQKPDFVMMDMNMPRLDGASTIRRIRENPAFDVMKIFAVSGQTAKQAGVDVIKNRVSAWFQKPLQPAKLVATIGTCFQPAV